MTRWFCSLALLFAACSGVDRRVPESKLIVGRTADALGLDPARVSDTESVEVCEQIYDSLVRYRKGTGEIEPALAERWEVSQSATEWVFHLRRRVRFHDGTRFDADAVVFNFDRQRDPRHPYHLPDFAYYQSNFQNVERVEKLDDYTVKVVIDRAYAPFLANLAMFSMGIVSPAAVQRWGDDYRFHPVGTGPFRFVEWLPGERITLARNAEYWGGRPPIANLIFVTIADEQQRLAALEGGAIDVATRLGPDYLQFVSLHPELKTERVAGNNVSYLAMNTEHPPFDDERVRIAVAHAVNKVPIVRMVYQGLAVPATGPLAPTTWGHVGLEDYAYSPERARRLLAETGYRPTRRPRLFVSSTPRSYLPGPLQVARTIARNLHDVGIDVQLVVQSFDEHLRSTAAGEHDLCLLGWNGDNGDPDNFLYGLLDSDNAVPGRARNVAFFKDAQLHGLLLWAQQSQDHARRAELYADAQRLIARRVPWVPLAHTSIVVARRKDVAGLVVPPSSVLNFSSVRLER